MKCPFCNHPDTQVVETRESEDGGFIRRRRRCGGCDKRFTTYERPEVSFPTVVKRDGRRIEYERAKLQGSFQIALRKRPVKASELDSAISRIEKQLQVSGEKEVTSKRVGDMVMLELKKLDNVAYVRYGSVYFNCGTLDDMIKLVENAREDQGKEGK